jgi:hypothetical protein
VNCDNISVINRRTIFESGFDPAAVKNLFLVQDLSFSSRELNILSLFDLFSDMRSSIHFELSTKFEIYLFLVYLLHTFSLTKWVLIWMKPYLIITLLPKTIMGKVSFKEINKCWSKYVFVFTLNPYLFYVKAWINNEIAIQRKPDTGFLKTLKNIAVNCDDISVISRRTIFESGFGPAAVKNLFLEQDLSFYSQELNILSLFQSDPFESTCNFNMSLIQPFLDHILNIKCDHNLDFCSYIINWILFLIQNMEVKLRQYLL